MPRGDRTGPRGEGPMTGRAAGLCGGYPAPGFANPVSGRRFWGAGGPGGSFGRGRGWRNQYWATGLPGWLRYSGADPTFRSYTSPAEPGLSPAEEGEVLTEQAAYLEQQLVEIKNRLSELKKTKTKEKE